MSLEMPLAEEEVYEIIKKSEDARSTYSKTKAVYLGLRYFREIGQEGLMNGFAYKDNEIPDMIFIESFRKIYLNGKFVYPIIKSGRMLEAFSIPVNGDTKNNRNNL